MKTPYCKVVDWKKEKKFYLREHLGTIDVKGKPVANISQMGMNICIEPQDGSSNYIIVDVTSIVQEAIGEYEEEKRQKEIIDDINKQRAIKAKENGWDQ